MGLTYRDLAKFALEQKNIDDNINLSQLHISNGELVLVQVLEDDELISVDTWLEDMDTKYFISEVVIIGNTLTRTEIDVINSALGYALKVHVNVEDGLDKPVIEFDNNSTTLVYSYDSSEGIRSKHDWEAVIEDLHKFIKEGSPQRKKYNNTRLFEGLGYELDLDFYLKY